jgi:catechol 2,3-dioxygenase
LYWGHHVTIQRQHTHTTPIDPATQVGLVALTVADLDRSVAFYTDALGFAVLQQNWPAATLGVAGTPLLLLAEHTGARPWPVYATGLYHFAILVPSRADLGRSLRRLLDLGYPMPGQADHLVSEALYLSDPDGNGIEIYRDRPPETWTWAHGQVRMATDPLDIRGLLAEAERHDEPWTGLRAGTRLGHIHLQVGDIAQAEVFYCDDLGFDVMARMPSALFVSAGGYHHHIGLNTWHSRGTAPAPAGTAGLRFFTLDLPNEEAHRAVVARIAAAGLAYTEAEPAVVVRDPWQNTILLQIGPAPDARAAMALTAAVPMA